KLDGADVVHPSRLLGGCLAGVGGGVGVVEEHLGVDVGSGGWLSIGQGGGCDGKGHVLVPAHRRDGELHVVLAVIVVGLGVVEGRAVVRSPRRDVGVAGGDVHHLGRPAA